MSNAHSVDQNPAAQILVRTWANLPLLLVSGSAVSAVAVLAEVLTPGITPSACLAWAVLVGPVFGALQAQINDIALGCVVRATSLPRYLRQYALLGLGTWAVPALSAAAGLVALQWWTSEHAVVAIVPLVLSCVVFVLALLGAITALSQGVSNHKLRGTALFLDALHVVARRPIPVVAVVAVMGLGLWAATSVSASFLLLMPAPVAITSFAAVWTSASSIGATPRRTGLSHST